MKKATFPLRFGPSLERLRNPFERATFVITNFPLCLLLSLLNLLKEVLSFDEEEYRRRKHFGESHFSLSLLLFSPTQTKMIPQENSFLSLSLSQNTEEKRDHRETMRSTTTTTTTATKNSLSRLSRLSLSTFLRD